jgi:hypothetical protein
MATAASPAPAWTPPASPWQVEAKDIACLRYFTAEEHAGRAPMRLSLLMVLNLLTTAGYSRAEAEENLRLGRELRTWVARYAIVPEQLATAGTRKAV